MKKLILSSLLLVAAGALYADETETVSHNNVTYSITQKGETVTTGEGVYTSSGDPDYSLQTFPSGYIAVTSYYSEDIVNTTPCELSPQSSSVIKVTINEPWDKEMANSSGKPVVKETTHFDYTTDTYATHMANVAASNSDILSLEKEITYYDPSDKEYYTFDDLVEYDSDYAKAYAYKVTTTTTNKKTGVTKETTTYYLINEVIVEKSVTTNTRTIYNCTVTTIPTGFITAEMTSLSLPNTITHIEENAFANASESLSLEGSNMHSGDSYHFYDNPSNPTRLIYVIPGMSKPYDILPNTLTKIDACAFKNIKNTAVFLTSSISTSSLQKGNGTQFITNTLPEGIVANDWLTSGIYAIPTSITTITPGAFKNATKLTGFDVSENDNFVYPSTVLYDKDVTTAIAAIPTVGDLQFPSTVGAVYDYAFANVNNNITISSTNANLQYDAAKQSSNVTWNVASATLSKVKEGHGYVITGNITAANFAALEQAGAFMDYTGATFLEAVTLNNIDDDYNRLYYFPAGTVVNGEHKNVVIGGICDNFYIDDSKNASFFAPTGFVANKTTYTRNIGSNWSTICLPFGITKSEFGEEFRVGELETYDSKNNVFGFLYAKTMSAYTPYIIKRIGSGSGSLVFTSRISVDATEDAIKTVTDAEHGGSATFTGVFEPVVKSADENNIVYGFAGGKMVRATGATFNPFRAFLSAPASSYKAEAATIRLTDCFDNEIEIIQEFNNETGISELNEASDKAIQFNLAGQKVNGNGIRIVNNKKIIVKN